MQEKLKGFLNKGKQWWSGTAKRTRILLGTVLAAMLVVIAVIVAVSMNRPYVTLFTELNQTDMSAIVTYLSDNGVTDYKVSGDNTILVPEDQEAQLKAALLTEGYPSSGFAYSTYFDHVGSLTTEAERNQLVLYELQDRTAAVIRSMDGVKDAVVQFTPGEDRTYVLDSGNVVEASAYVMVTMKDGMKLDSTQAQGIRNLVSRSMQGLKVDNISIVDAYGNTYSTEDSLTDIQDTSALKLQLEEQVNNTVRTNIMQVLTPLYGADNVRVSVNSTVNVDRSYTDSTDYSLEDWATGNDDGIIGKRIWDDQIVRDDGADTAGGVAGTESNADLSTYVEQEQQVDGTEQVVSSSGESDRLVDTTKQQVEHVSGYISDVMVSVTINQSAAGGVDETDLYPHIARAAGIGEDIQDQKIHVLIAPFYQENADAIVPGGPSAIPMWVILAAGGGLAVFLVLLAIFLLLRRRKKRKQAAQLADQMAEMMRNAPVTAQAAPEGADIMDMDTEKSMELRKDVREFAEENPEIAAQMVKAWLREGDSVE